MYFTLDTPAAFTLLDNSFTSIEVTFSWTVSSSCVTHYSVYTTINNNPINTTNTSLTVPLPSQRNDIVHTVRIAAIDYAGRSTNSSNVGTFILNGK